MTNNKFNILLELEKNNRFTFNDMVDLISKKISSYYIFTSSEGNVEYVGNEFIISDNIDKLLESIIDDWNKQYFHDYAFSTDCKFLNNNFELIIYYEEPYYNQRCVKKYNIMNITKTDVQKINQKMEELGIRTDGHCSDTRKIQKELKQQIG
ncbi:MAG: hypothetical protein Edafosvirus32_10 [Edafosvirus sp.]|uniref:Uncharacterized protein n=1 Tax=Edafosvirus sp. TaxID=2487765 RepID=A0A3G4ZZJ2_9VIRU|nr:MAG: hypothetical protein Edafosvirus32_10 [Edafosvirus sp.]